MTAKDDGNTDTGGGETMSANWDRESPIVNRNAAVSAGTVVPARKWRWRTLLPRLLAFLLAGGVVAAYALPGGVYDLVIRQEYGLVVWALVAVGVAVGLLPRARPSRPMLVVLGALLAYTTWVALSLIWTQSSGRTAAELARSLDYLGLCVLAGSVVDRRLWRDAAAGPAFGSLVVCASLRRAVARESTNYRHWLILARIEAEQGLLAQAARDFAHAHRLRPRGDVFSIAFPDSQ